MRKPTILPGARRACANSDRAPACSIRCGTSAPSALGAAAAVLGDAVSLGFMTETEAQVEGHLASHLDRLPASDLRSRGIVQHMKNEESAHGQAARARGAAELPTPIPSLMRVAARVMTGTAYWL